MKMLRKYAFYRGLVSYPKTISIITRADPPKYGGSIKEGGGAFGRKEHVEELKYFREKERQEIEELRKALKRPITVTEDKTKSNVERPSDKKPSE